jgi:ABC-type multidrug transport system ATPase subunit
MSVKEAFRHSAFCRMDRGAENRVVVNDVLGSLNLYHCRHTRIGDVARRGISGGEKKRANIGLEIVADPSVLFLDEPTV